MNSSMRGLWCCLLTLFFAIAPPVFAQCEPHLLGCLDEETTPQTYAVSVWTDDVHCPASGHIMVHCNPPYFEFGPYIDSFFDVFTEVHRVKPPLNMVSEPPPYVPFFLEAIVTFDDPAYPDMAYVEQVMWDPGLGRLVIFRPSPCLGDDVPPSMAPMTAACFKVCHRIYRVDLGSRLVLGQPIISVVPGCGMETNCEYDPCVPGGENDYVYNVYASGGRWILEFEYSNPNAEPRCYCVSYTGNQPQGYTVNRLAALNELDQTLDVTLWTELPGHEACGHSDVFSYPPGAYVGQGDPLFHATDEKRTVSIPVGPGSFPIGSEFELITYLDFGPPEPCEEYQSQWLVEHVRVTPQGGLEAVDVGGECDQGAVNVPPILLFGQPECITVCHDIYHIPLDFTGPGTPEVSVLPGCDPSLTPCADPTCNPGGPTDYRYDLIQVGGSWILEVEYSNPQNEPACYCIEFYNIIPQPHEPRVLGALDEQHQTFNVSLWSTDCMWPWNGEFTVSTNPPYRLDGERWVQSFFDVFCAPHGWEFPVQPSDIASPGDNFQITVECDYFGPGSDPFDGIIYAENVVVTPDGQLARWDPSSPCTGDAVPSSMIPGQSECFIVCHRVYETVLFYNEGGGQPVISVTPGCQGQPMDNCEVHPCVPGGPQDFVYDVYHNGVDWILRFEYSNPYVEPVCYCVTYEGNVPYDCTTLELAALDEGHMQFEVSLRTYSPSGMECPANGNMTIFSNPPGALIGGYPDSFFDVFTEWHTVSPPVDPGSFGPGETFQLVAWIQYEDPDYPDVWLTEDCIIDPTGQSLGILDVGGECTDQNVPPTMTTGSTECFKVCHRVYHVAITDATDPAQPPTMTITPGCYGPPFDQCLPDPDCMPGGPLDYRYDVLWAGDHWELEFEYSNENIEPVCYCVTVEGVHVPCETHELVAFDAENQLLKVSLSSYDPSGRDCPVSGTMTVSSNPPDLYFEQTSWPFSGVGEQWQVFEVPAAAPPDPPQSFFDVFVEINFDDPGQPDVMKTESVQRDPASGGLLTNDVGGECPAGSPQVPPELIFGQPECFIVCHDIYYIPLVFPGPGIPVVTVTPGCDPVLTGCQDSTCVPGGPFDYRYDVFKVGGSWILEFEYSNPNIEPVCYCVEISSIQPVPYEAYLLAALDEPNQLIDITLWTSADAPLAEGELIVKAAPDVTMNIPFSDVGSDYSTWELPVGIGTLTQGQTFQLSVVAQFLDPILDAPHFEETVIVLPGGTLTRWDPISPCVGDHVPPVMDDNSAACFVVCHRIYDVLLNVPQDVPPVVTITPGCFGPPFDNCLHHPLCRPGGPNDYCYRFYYDGANWHLIFEYSNPYREPVCYCVSIGQGPCWPVTDLVIHGPDPEAGTLLYLTWTSPQSAMYIIYSTDNPNNHGNPPGPGWTVETAMAGAAGERLFFTPTLIPPSEYRNFVVKADCSPPSLNR